MINDEFICKAALATINYIDSLDIINVTQNENGFYDLHYTVDVNGGKYKHGGQLKVLGNSVIGGFYDAKGRLTPMEQQEIKFKEDENVLFIISVFNDAREERQFSEWVTFRHS